MFTKKYFFLHSISTDSSEDNKYYIYMTINMTVMLGSTYMLKLPRYSYKLRKALKSACESHRLPVPVAT